MEVQAKRGTAAESFTPPPWLLVVAAVAGIGLIIVLGFDGYRETFGYSARQLQEAYCPGKHLIRQDHDGFGTRLKCTTTPRDKALPMYLLPFAVRESERFLLSEADDLCKPRTRPRAVDGRLVCEQYR